MNFDPLARHYDWLEDLTAGGRLQEARTAWLPELRDRRRILSVGEGHGRFAAACAQFLPKAELTCVEASARMLSRGQKRSRGLSVQIDWRREDVLTWQPTGRFDALVTCFFLDCFPPETLAQIVAKLASCADQNALWLVVDFAIPANGPARWRARLVHALMYGFFRKFVGLPARRLTPPDELLRAEGFSLIRRRDFNWGLLRADLWHRG